MSNRKKKGYRWSYEDKGLALSLFHASPKAYKLIHKLFILPSIATLKRTMSKIAVYAGFNINILEALKAKLDTMPKGSELCLVAFDEMAIKESVVYNPERDEVEGFEDFGVKGKTQYIANHATVFLVRGLVYKWKQTVGYVLSSGPINSNVLHGLLLECLDNVQTAGLDVKVIIADQGSNNRSMFERYCGATANKPYFEHNGKQIFIMYDPPHLLKNVRNNLKKTGFLIGESEILWSHIEMFYRFDSQNPVRMAPKLSRKHIDPPPFAKMSVKLAAQVLSHSVAAGVSTLVQVGVLPQSAIATANFIEKIDSLFNAFNSSGSKKSQSMRHAFHEKSGHKTFLEETHEWLKSVRPRSGRSLPCLSGWIMSINSLLSLWKELHETHGVQFLCTNRLNQDAVENLFSCIRGKGGYRYNPDAQQFRQALRATMIDTIMTHSNSSNCIEDIDTFLLRLESLGSTKKDRGALDQSDSAFACALDIDPQAESLWLNANLENPQPSPEATTVENNVMFYIAGYVARRLKTDREVCCDCREALVGTSTQNQFFFSHKHFANAKEGLVVPSQDLFLAITSLESVYRMNFAHYLHVMKIKMKLYNKLQSVQCKMLSAKCCKLSEKVCKLFLNVRLHFSLKDNSRKFSVSSGKRNRKLVEFSHK